MSESLSWGYIFKTPGGCKRGIPPLVGPWNKHSFFPGALLFACSQQIKPILPLPCYAYPADHKSSIKWITRRKINPVKTILGNVFLPCVLSRSGNIVGIFYKTKKKGFKPL